MPPTVLAPIKAVSKPFNSWVDNWASVMASSNACRASNVVRVSPGSCAFNFCCNKRLLILISPKGSSEAYLVGNNSSGPIPDFPCTSALWFSVTLFPIALIAPIPVTKILLNGMNLLRPVFFNIVYHGIDVY